MGNLDNKEILNISEISRIIRKGEQSINCKFTFKNKIAEKINFKNDNDLLIKNLSISV